MNHSPGPWMVRPDYGKDNVYRLWNENGNYHDDTSIEVMDANAQLMTAAPSLAGILIAILHEGLTSRTKATAKTILANAGWMGTKAKRKATKEAIQ